MANSIQPVRNAELFRFVNVRNPKSSSPAIPKGQAPLHTATAIRFDTDLGSGSEMHPALRKLASHETLQVDGYLSAAASFRKSKSYLPGVDEARAALPTQLLSELQGASPSTIDGAIEYLSTTTGFDGKAPAQDPGFVAAYTRAWDNLFLQGISARPDMGLVHALSEAIRVMDLMLRLPFNRERKEFKAEYVDAVRASYLLFPKELLPKGSAKGSAAVTESISAKEKAAYQQRRELVDSIANLQAARELLTEWAELQLSSPAAPADDITAKAAKPSKTPATPPPPATPPTLETLAVNAEALKRMASLSPDGPQLAQTIQGYLPTGGSLPYTKTLSRLESAATQMNQKLIHALPEIGQKVVAVGKSILLEPLPDLSGSDMRAKGQYTGITDADNVKIRNIGTGDLMRVEHKQICYRPGEIAHIENVLSGEERERRTRRLKRSEENFSEEVEKFMEEERDLETTERNEMETEASRTMSQEFGLDSGLNVSGSYGMVKFDASLGFSMNLSQQESNRTAKQFSREVVEKTRRKVSERLKSSKSMTLIEEFEENNSHKLTNDGPDHKVGIYRWIDKYMKARLVNYGKRAFLQFSVPEPAAFHIHNKAESPKAAMNLTRPIAPSDPSFQSFYGVAPLKSFRDLNEANYNVYAAFYNVGDIRPYGANTIHHTETISIPDKGAMTIDANYYVAGKNIPVPAGYVATRVNFRVSSGSKPQKTPTLHLWHNDKGANANDVLLKDYEDGKLFMFSAEDLTFAGPSAASAAHFTGSYSQQLSFAAPYYNVAGRVIDGGVVNQIAVTGKSLLPVLATVTVTLKRTQASYEEWQIATYNSIVGAYQAKLAEFEEGLKNLQYELTYISGNNPGMNREIEQRELKRGCMEELLSVRETLAVPCNYRWGMYMGVEDEAINCTNGAFNYPSINIAWANAAGRDVMFFEQALEWKHMSYVFYPYFWGRRCQWKSLYSLEDNDPLFLKFLQAGMARVVVPIRPGFEAALMNYLETGLVWDSQDQPLIGDPMFVDIVEEIKEAFDYNEGPIADEDPRVVAVWEYKLPTNLVIVQRQATAYDEDGLPCQQKPLIE